MSNPQRKPIKAKPRLNAVAQYLMALAAVIGCYSLYAKYAVPVLEGPPNLIPKRTFVAFEDLPPASEEKTHLAPFLPGNSWELGDCQTLLTPTGTILFQKFEEQPDGSLTVIPFTLFSGLESKFSEPQDSNKSDDGKKRPTVLRCVQGANLKFDKPMSQVYEGKANLESARLIGNVDIYQPPSTPQALDAMQIMTSNVQIDKKRIYTLDNVQFEFGRNRGSGRNLMIDLAHGDSPGTDFSNIEGARRMELAFLHNLRIEPSESSNAFSGNSSATSQLFSNRKSPIEVACQGRFIFDFETKIASFENKVKATRVDAYMDSIECEKLVLTFEDKPDSNSELNGAAIETNGTDKPEMGDLKLKSMVAEGTPAVLTSRSRSAKVSGEFLSYDVASDQVFARCDPQNDLLVTLVHPEYQMVTKQLRYIIPKNNSLGPIEASGPGRLLKLASKKQKQFFASWKKGLSTIAGDQLGMQKIILDGNTLIRIGDETQVNADRLELLVWQIPITTTDAASKKSVKWDYDPFKIICHDNVTIESPKFSGSAKKLTATWPNRASAPLTNRLDHQVGYRGTLQILQDLQHARGVLQQQSTARPRTTPFRTATETRSQVFSGPLNSPQNFQDQNIQPAPGFVEQAGFIEETPAPAEPTKAPTKIKFSGDEVEVLLQGSGKETEVRDLTVIGNVHVTEVKPTPTKGTPLSINGDHLRLIPQGKDSYRVLVSRNKTSSQQAKIVAEDFELTGEQINLDQVANKIWVDGAGSMKLDASEAIKSAAPQFNNLNKVPVASENLDVSWQGGMIFDGAKIYFERQVVMSAIQPDKDGRSVVKSLSEGLRVELDEAVDFKNISKNKKVGKAKVRELVFVNEIAAAKQVFQLAGSKVPAQNPTGKLVVIENKKFDLAGKLLEKQNIIVPNATVNAETGKLYAKGPGTIATHRDGSRGNALNPLGGLTKSKKQGLSFVQINFDGELDLDSEEKTMTVSRNVRTIYAPIQSWGQTFNPDNSRRLAPPESVNLNCQQLRIAQWKPRGQAKAETEMIATGNIRIQSQTVESTADRLSYKQSTDVMVIEGTSRNEANLWFKQSPNDKNPKHLAAEKISYRLKDKSYQMDGVKNISAK